jgi:two-component system, cell cycle sensor histidine kinase and response regulator CckA
MRSSRTRILLADQDERCAGLLRSLVDAGSLAVDLVHVRSVAAAEHELARGSFDAVLLAAGDRARDDLERLRRTAPDVPIVAVTEGDDSEAGMQTLQDGAQDFLARHEITPGLLRRSLRYARERAALRKVEEQLRQAHKMEAVGRLAGGIAHDFNNVLTAIFGYTDLLLEQLDEGDQKRDDVEEIRRAAHRAATLTRQLLAFSRKQVMQPRLVDLNAVAGSVERMLARVVGSEVRVSFRPAEEVGAVRADPGQIEQVLVNLSVNARDAMPDGGDLVISTGNCVLGADDVRVLPGLAPGEYVTLSVRDTGGGIPDSIRPHIFEPFFTTKAQGKGTGLGLATVYGIVKQSGGGIYVDSARDRGTTFTIYLPRIAESVQQPDPTPAGPPDRK